MARTQDIQTGIFRKEEAAKVSEDTYRTRTKRATPVSGDLLYSREGTYFGVAAEVPENCKVCLGQRMVLLRPESTILTTYLRYWLNSPQMQAYIHGFRAGSVAERLNLRAIRRLPVATPPLREQEAIAEILSALDDKIELNRKMNRTLEEIAQTLFRAWFVDFEGETDLVESEVGLIPRGWEVGSLGEVTRLEKETVKPADYPAKEWEHFSIPRFDEARLPVYERGVEIKSGKYRVPATAILVSKLNPRFPRIWRVKVEDEETAVSSTEFLPLVPRKPKTRALLFELLRSDPVISAIQSRATGTTGSRQRVKPKDVLSVPVALPQKNSKLADFSRLVEPLHERVQLNLDQSETLAEIRDTLLPKLISGEIRVPAAEEVVEQAV